MLLNAATLAGIEAGTIDLAFRRWKRPTVRTGGTLRSPIGMLAIDDVRPIELDDITDDEARRAGHGSAAEVVAFLETREGTPYRVALRKGGADPRAVLQQQAELDEAELAAVLARLARLDARGPTGAAGGAWTTDTLAIIGRRPAVRAGDLADELGRERLAFKTDVRKLKNLGLTISLEIGYRLSPRGERVLAALRSGSPS